MNFTIEKIILWLVDNTQRILNFETNKVNVITGDSNTGKTTIFYIIDYCLLASKTKIPEEIINENVNWYGIKIKINGKSYTIARKALENRKPSDCYYFSGSGVIPETPEVNFSENELKSLIEKEFEIDSKLVVPYGGKKIPAGSKISFRYFLLFNTQLENTIINSDVFFDKQNDEKYREALERIFDIAIGVLSPEDTLRREKLEMLEKKYRKISRLQKQNENKEEYEKKDVSELISRAKELGLISSKTESYDEDYINLNKLLNNYDINGDENDSNTMDELSYKKLELERRERILKRFDRENNRHKDLLKNNYDSLLPIAFLKERYGEKLERNKELFDDLEKQLEDIKREINNKKPFGINIKAEIENIGNELKKINEKIDRQPRKKIEIKTEIEKYVLIGEIKEKFRNTFLKVEENYIEELADLENSIETLNEHLKNYYVRRKTNQTMLEEFIQTYIDQAEDVLENYKGFKAFFDYENKLLNLRKPKSDIPSIVGSSSNQLFLHLCFFLGLHELIINKEIPYIPNFLLLDQPSRPYYEKAKKEELNIETNYSEIVDDDRKKITKAFHLLNDFIDFINQKYGKEFQFIVVEHIPEEVWIDAKLKNVCLVDEKFIKNKNALIKYELANKIRD